MRLTISELIEASLAGHADDEAGWEPIWTLRRLGTQEVFDAAVELLQSPSAASMFSRSSVR